MNRTIVADRWDLLDLDQALHVPAFLEQRAVMGEVLAPWGAGALDDVFLLLFKARPQVAPRVEVDDVHMVGHVLVSLLASNPTVQRLRQSTMRDVVAAATAAAKMAPQLTATAEGLGTPDGIGEHPVSWGQLERAVEDGLGDLEAVAEEAADDAEHQVNVSTAWGLASGELQHLPLAERLALAQKLDTPRVRQITELFGRLRDSMFAERTEVVGPGIEPVDVEVGGDLSRMVGGELLSMLNEDLFYARLGDGALRQYAMQGIEQTDRGGIVLCVDCSWSMSQPFQGYSRELWASALKLVLLQAAKRDRRPLHVLNFSTKVSYHRLVDPEERTPERLLEAAGEWYGYGTDFARPLTKVVEIFDDEDDRDSDVVFVSDGECAVPGRVRQFYQRSVRGRGVRTWGVQLGRDPGGLTDFCDHIFTVTDLTSGRELGDLLNAVET